MSRDIWYPSCRVCPPEKPHFPPACGGSSVSVNVFGRGCGCDRCSVTPAAPPVTVVNPWNCREKAVVYLGIDECGNLVVSVKRD